jgi:ectoine hydroxylase-related dioxygenase (phytanoyl-CoA dioxygenase family)
MHISQADVDFYHREGYLILRGITTLEDIAVMRAAYDQIFAERAGREEGNQFDLAGADEEGVEPDLPQILSPSRYAPELADTLYLRNALIVARQLLGDEARHMGEHAILKPAGHGAATPWHQDEAYWDPGLEYNALSVWLPLQEATVENGCMHFIPGSHKLDVQPHHSINNDPRVHGLEIDEVDDSTAAACPLEPGDATFHHARTLHYAGPNHTHAPRRALILGFGTLPTKRETVRDFYWNDQKTSPRITRAEEFAKARESSP